ncbi:hypothetical protein [Sporocytophaga myxococcoides]|nr:hypothetical protein [Sporocytophaga myxococcoides]
MKEYVKSFHLLTEDEINTFLSKAEVCNLERGKYFIRESNICISLLSGI